MRLRTASFLLLAPAVLLLACLFAYPLLVMLRISLGAPGWTLDQYSRFVLDSHYLGVLARSLALGIVVSAATITLGLPVAYWLARLQSRWASGLLLLATFPLWVSAVVRSFGWIVLLARNGALSHALQAVGLATRSFQLAYTMTGVVLALTQVLLPYAVLSLYAVIRGIDPEFERAAQNLGAGPWKAAALTTVPMAGRGILSTALLIFALAISAFATPSLVGGARVQLMSTTIYEQMNELADWPFASAVSFVLLAVVLLISLAWARLTAPDTVRVR